MARGKRKRSKKPVAKATEDDSDASDAQNDELEPEDYLEDEVDDFYSRKDKVLIDAARDLEPADSSEGEEEVMALNVPDSDAEEEEEEEEEDDDEMADSDMGEQDDDMPDKLAWGKKKSLYYNTDYVDEDLPGVIGDEEEEEAQQEEEREALAIQKRMTEALSEEDFGLDLFKPAKRPTEDATLPEEEAEERVLQDLSHLSHRERMELLKKEAPELKELMDDFKEKLQEVIDRLHPLLKMVRSGIIPPGKGATYVETKFQLYLNYCVNISFYLVLKADHTPNVRSHPVINRLVQYRNLINELEPLDQQLEPEVSFLLQHGGEGEGEALHGGGQTARRKQKGKQKPADTQADGDDVAVEEAVDTQQTEKSTKLKKRKKEHLTAAEKEAIEFYEQMKAKRRKAQLEEEESSGEEEEDIVAEDKPTEGQEEEGEEEDGKRAITYEISKNKGLTPKRKKEERNPRVKLRKKYRKAKIRRKGQVREPRTELRRYDGEFSGIKAGVKKSTRLIT
ncbi:something about silencing protein 10-like [Branchiostoma lanceolatum]|uniref:something about silencing protein 10-like n=1 Tax=Branchiostoma lanceolatum TaxID=7740 RepID=UPI003452ECF8